MIVMNLAGIWRSRNGQESKGDLRVYVGGQPAQGQEHAEKVTLQVLEIAATKMVPILIAMI